MIAEDYSKAVSWFERCGNGYTKTVARFILTTWIALTYLVAFTALSASHPDAADEVIQVTQTDLGPLPIALIGPFEFALAIWVVYPAYLQTLKVIERVIGDE